MKKQNIYLLISIGGLLILFIGCKKSHEPQTNLPPIVNAGQDQSILFPKDSTELSGVGADYDGRIIAYKWTKLSGPLSTTIVSPSAPDTRVKNLVRGAYIFQLKATDNGGLTAVDQVMITVSDTIDPCNGCWDY